MLFSKTNFARRFDLQLVESVRNDLAMLIFIEIGGNDSIDAIMIRHANMLIFFHKYDTSISIYTKLKNNNINKMFGLWILNFIICPKILFGKKR